jgi:hypothetical protein
MCSGRPWRTRAGKLAAVARIVRAGRGGSGRRGAGVVLGGQQEPGDVAAGEPDGSGVRTADCHGALIYCHNTRFTHDYRR